MKKMMIIIMALAMMALPVFAWSETGCANSYSITFSYANLTATKIPITLITPTDFNSSDMFIVNGADDTRLNYALENSTRAWVEGNWTDANITQMIVYYNCSGTGGTSEQNYNTFITSFSDNFDTDLSQWNMIINNTGGVAEIVNESFGENILHLRGGTCNGLCGMQEIETFQDVPLELQVDYDLGVFSSEAYIYGARSFFWGADDNITSGLPNNYYLVWGNGYNNGFGLQQSVNGTETYTDFQTGDLGYNVWNHYTLTFFKNITGDGYYYANLKTTGDMVYYNGKREFTFTLGENFTDTGARKAMMWGNPISVNMYYDNLTIKYYAQEPQESYNEEFSIPECNGSATTYCFGYTNEIECNAHYDSYYAEATQCVWDSIVCDTGVVVCSRPIPKYVNWSLSPDNTTDVSITPHFNYNTATNYNTSRYRLSGGYGYLFDSLGNLIDTAGTGGIYFGHGNYFDMRNFVIISSLNYSTTYYWNMSGTLYDYINDTYPDYPKIYSSNTYTFTTESAPTTTTTIEPTTTTTVIEAPTGDVIAVTGNMIYALVVLLMAGFMFYIVKERFGK